MRRSASIALVALLALTLVRLVIAWAAPLAPDEAYYWVWSRALAPGYLDAPPMVALWIRAGTAIAGDGALGIRLLGPLSGVVGSLLLWDAAERLLPGRHAGITAAALLNATLLFGVGTVVMTPDTPLLFFWVACLWALARFHTRREDSWLLAAGLFAGLALASKYTAIFLAPAILLWLLLVPDLRRWLIRPAPWLGVLAAFAVFAPVIVWNAAHHWASFAKQGGRVGDFRPTNAIRFLGELALGQAGLATPLIFVLCVAGTVLALRRGWGGRQPGCTLLALLTIIPAIVFVQHAFGDRVQANWPAVLYPSAVIAASGLKRRVWMRLRAPAVTLGFLVTALAYIQAATFVLPLPVRADPVAMRLGGWPELAAQVQTARRQLGASFIAADDYGQAAELARSVPGVIGVEPRWPLFDLPHPDLAGKTGILVRSARRGRDIDTRPWASIRPLADVERKVGDRTVERYHLYRVVGRVGARDEEALLPRPALPK